MKEIKKYILSQVAEKKLYKESALSMLKELFVNENNTTKIDDIAIIGMACRFPQANELDEFWNNLANGVDSIVDFPKERKKDVDQPIRDYFRGKRNAPEIVYRKGGYLDKIDHFDAEYFNISAAEAKLMDPLQRIFLEVTWRALEDAGYSEKELNHSRTGIYVGDTDADYLKLIQNMEPYALPGNTISIMASRISYILNLASASHLIDTACSASLAAVHHAIKGLVTGDCDIAIAGGINLTLFPIDEGFQDIGIASPDYKIRTFDESANGTVWGEGCGVIILKTLEKAKKDHDHIYAVIKGSSMNSDGKTNGITAPSGLAQAELIKEAWKNAGIDPETITYIETHGTATKLGDPIEVEGITKAFESYTDKKQFCALGALKTNIGHLDTGAGLAGLIKVALSLQHKEIPGVVHFHMPNSFINFIDSPVYINTKLKPWDVPEGVPRRAGVSAFGLAGTNCHVILEEYNESEREKGISQNRQYIFTISSKSKESFDKLICMYCNYLRKTSDLLEDICFTSNQGRGHYKFRLVVVVSSVEELRHKMEIFQNTPEKQKMNLTCLGINYTCLSNVTDNVYTIKEGSDIELIVSAYMDGCTVNWCGMYDMNKVHRVSLPVYPFIGKRYWIQYRPENQFVDIVQKKQDIGQYFYEIKWVEKPLNTSEFSLNTQNKRWLIFNDDEGFGDQVSELMKQNLQDVVMVSLGDNFMKIDDNHYKLNPSSIENYIQLMRFISEKGMDNFLGIIHMWNCGEIKSNLKNLDDLTYSQNIGAKSLFYIIKSLKVIQFDKPFILKSVTNYAQLITDEDIYVYPEKASFLSITKVVSQENTNVSYSCIDIDTIGRDAKDVAQELYKEIFMNSNSYSNLVAWRKSIRYVQEFDRLQYSNLKKRKIAIKENGVYLIAGGCGSVGFDTCRYIAKRAKVKLIIVNRMKLPDRTEWDTLLNKQNDELVVSRVRNLLDLEALGAEVNYYSIDVADLVAMKKLKENLIARYGKIDGVINMTMNLYEKPIALTDESDFDRSMASKVIGTWVLNEITKDQKLDFFILFSSIASVLGGKGLGSYTAANAFLDQYAHYQSKRGLDIMSVDWSYLEMGLSEEEKNSNVSLAYPITMEEYEHILDVLFTYKSVQPIIANIDKDKLKVALELLAISVSDNVMSEQELGVDLSSTSQSFKKLLEKYNELKNLIEDNDEIRESIKNNVTISAKFVSFEENLKNFYKPKPLLKNTSKMQVRLKGRDNDLYSETEQRLAQIWGEVLGEEVVDINNEFFEYGDSLMLMSVLGRIRSEFSIDLYIEVFYQEPTIAALSYRIDNEGANDDLDELEEIEVLPRFFSEE